MSLHRSAWDPPVRLGLIGLGEWGEHVALAARNVPGVTIAACYARSPETHAALAARHHCTACSSYADMLCDSSIEGIVVMTPNQAHREPVVAAAACGKPCLVTKPIATSADDARAMIHTWQAAGVMLVVGHPSRREPALRRLKRLLAANALGQPVLVEANISTGAGLAIQPGEWRWSSDECPGGPLIQLGVHQVDTLQYLLGQIVRVQGWQRRVAVPAEIDDTTCTPLEFQNGLLGYLGAGYASSEACWIKIYGTAAVAHYGQHLGLVISQDSWETGPVRRQETPGMQLTAPISTMQEEIAEFAECIRTGKSPEIDGWQALRNLAVVSAAIESNSTGRAVVVDRLLTDEEARHTLFDGANHT
jgi:UDP-N-acetyl-2-amino-2-deoxyglucuronate dehydrogenase